MSIDVEAARPGDGPAIGAILSDWIDETSWMPRIHTKEQDLSHGSWLIEVCDVFVVRDQGHVAGFLARQGGDIQALYVANEARRSGIGSALIHRAMADLDMLELWTFQANHAAVQFYGRLGFAEDRRGDGSENDEKLPDIHMIWQRDET